MAKNRFGDEEVTAQTAATAPRPAGDIMGQVQDIGRGFWENLAQSGESLINMTEGAINTVRHPYETFVEGKKGIVKGLADASKAQDALRLKVVDALKQGDYGAAASNALYYMIPLLGPQLAEQGEMFKQGEWGRGLGHVGATATQLAAPEMLKGSQVALSPRFQVRSQLTDVEKANQAFLTRKGVDTSLAMETGSKPAGGLQASVRQSVGGSQYAEDKVQATRQKIRDVAEQELQQIAPGPSVTPAQAGEAVIGKFKGDIRFLDADAKTAYKNAWNVEKDPANVRQVPKEVETSHGWDYVTDPQGNQVMQDMELPHDMRPMKDALRPIAREYERTLSDTDARASLGLKTMREIIKGPDFKPLSQAEKDLGLLKDAARTEKGMKELRDPSQGLAALSLAQLQQDIDATMAAAQGGQQGLQNLQRGRSLTAQKHAIYEQARKFGKPNIEDLEPVSVFNKLTGDKDIRVNFVNRIRAMAPAQMPMVGRAFIEEILNRVFREGDIKHAQQALNQWDDLGRENKMALFRDAKLVDDLDQTMLALKRISQEVNPSGSGYMVELNRMKGLLTTAVGAAAGFGGSGGTGAAIGAGVGGIGGTMALNAGLARLLFNPKYSRILRQGVQLQLKGDHAGAAALFGLLSKAAQEPLPETDRKPLHLFVK